MARQVTEWWGEGSELPEPTLDEAIRWASDRAILEEEREIADEINENDPYTDDPITLYRSRGEVLE